MRWQDQIVNILDNATRQPLPSEVFEQLTYNIEEVDGDWIYYRIKEEISSRSFEVNQELTAADFELVLKSLKHRKEVTLIRVDEFYSLEKLIEKVEIISEN